MIFFNQTVISIFAGLGGMFGWGTSDFLASRASEKIGNQRTFFWSQVIGVIFFTVLALITYSHFSFSPFLFFLIVLSGLLYASGYLLFYRGFEIGNISVVSAVINLQNVIVVVISYLMGQRIHGLQIPACCYF